MEGVHSRARAILRFCEQRLLLLRTWIRQFSGVTMWYWPSRNTSKMQNNIQLQIRLDKEILCRPGLQFLMTGLLSWPAAKNLLAERAHSPEDGWRGREGGCPACLEDADEVFASMDFGHGAAAA